jgi:integrase
LNFAKQIKINMKVFLISYKFYLRELQSNSLQSIYCRITINRKKSEFATGYRCNQSDWDEIKQRCKAKHSKINEGLTQIESAILDIRLDYQKSNKNLTAKMLKMILNGELKTTYTLLEYAKLYIKKRIETEGAKVVLSQTQRAVGYLEAFLKGQGRLDIAIGDFNKGMLRDFEVFLQNFTYGAHNKKFQTNTIHKYLTKIRAIFIYALQDDIINKNPYFGFRLKKEQKRRMGLDYQQVKKMMQLDLSDRPEIEITRDCFLFSCFTGLRYSDTRVIGHSNLYFDASINTHVLKFIPQKSKHYKTDEMEIPLVESAMKIIAKYEGHPLAAGKDRLLPIVSNQKTNKKLKELQILLGMNGAPLTYHLSRHTLSTCLSNIKTPDHIKDAVMGHANHTMTAQYSRNIQITTQLDLIKDIENKIQNA